MSKNKSKSLLSDKIADILSTTPGQLDPEDDIYEDTKAKVTTNEELSDNEEIESGRSKIRTENAALLEDEDERYLGKKCSRKSLKDSDQEWSTEDEGLSTDEGEDLDGVPGTQNSYYEENSDDQEDESESEGSKNSGSEEESFDGGSITLEDANEEDNFKHMSESNLPNQMKKGNSVRSQLSIWESLLETRIQMQKCLITANKLPQTNTYMELKKDTNFKNAATTTVKSVSDMLNKFLLLQNLVLKQYGETKNLLKDDKKGKESGSKDEEGSDEEIPSDTEEEDNKLESDESSNESEPVKKRRKLSDFESEIKQRHLKYKSYRNNTIQKWNDKTRLASGKNSAVTNTVLQQIDYLLNDKNRLIKKSQLKKSDFEVLGKSTPESDSQNDVSSKVDEYDTEIYDDTDFYHQLLRELIEVKSGDVTDPIQMSRQWIALQNLRSKMKRKIDTKATKGRKIRYVVHSKLVNFMAPITDNCWTNEAKNELYSSLFGKNQIVK